MAADGTVECPLFTDGTCDTSPHCCNAGGSQWAGGDGAADQAPEGTWVAYRFAEPTTVGCVQMCHSEASHQQMTTVLLQYTSDAGMNWGTYDVLEFEASGGGDTTASAGCSVENPCPGGAFCNFDGGDSGACELCGDCEGPSGCYDCGLPTAGGDDCMAQCGPGGMGGEYCTTAGPCADGFFCNFDGGTTGICEACDDCDGYNGGCGTCGLPAEGEADCSAMCGTSVTVPSGSTCADLNGDGEVTVDDLLDLLSAFGSVSAEANLVGEDIINVDDLLALLSQYGSSCTVAPPPPTTVDCFGLANGTPCYDGNPDTPTDICHAGICEAMTWERTDLSQCASFLPMDTSLVTLELAEAACAADPACGGVSDLFCNGMFPGVVDHYALCDGATLVADASTCVFQAAGSGLPPPDACFGAPNGVLCDDGNADTPVDICHAGVCEATSFPRTDLSQCATFLPMDTSLVTLELAEAACVSNPECGGVSDLFCNGMFPGVVDHYALCSGTELVADTSTCVYTMPPAEPQSAFCTANAEEHYLHMPGNAISGNGASSPCYDTTDPDHRWRSGASLFYTDITECMDVCDVDPDCMGVVDNFQRTPPYCVFKRTGTNPDDLYAVPATIRVEPTKDVWLKIIDGVPGNYDYSASVHASRSCQCATDGSGNANTGAGMGR
jgi:hypothetical protein